MTESEDPGANGRSSSRVVRVVLIAVGVLAAVAVATVVLADDARWLRLGVVTALWAALVAVWAVVRRPAGADVEALRGVYELELAAEVDARQAHELTVESEVRRELEAARGSEIEAMRAEIERLRAALEQRGGVSPVPVTRLQVVGGTAAPEGADRADRADRRAGPVADLRTVGIPSPPSPWPASGPSGSSPDRSSGRPRAARPSPRPAPGPHPDTTSGAAVRGSGVTGRTVAELLAAHAASERGDHDRAIGGRRRRDR